MMSEKEQEPLKEVAANDSTSAPTATSNNNASAKKDQLFRLFLLFLMTAQNSSVVLLSRYTRAGVSKDDMYVINDIVMVSEMAKVRIIVWGWFNGSESSFRFRLFQCYVNYLIDPDASSTNSYSSVGRGCNFILLIIHSLHSSFGIFSSFSLQH